MRASQLIALRRWDQALGVVVDGLTSDPQDYLLLGLAVQCCLGLDRPVDAVEYAEMALAVNPAGEWAHRLHSTALRSAGRYHEAAIAASEAVALSPEGAEGFICLASAYLSSLRRSVRPRAIPAAREAIRLAPESTQAWLVLGVAYERVAQWPWAEWAFREALARDPESVHGLLGLGRMLERRGEQREATELFASALVLDPTNLDAQGSLRVLARARRGESARTVIRRRFSMAGAAALIGGLPRSASTPMDGAPAPGEPTRPDPLTLVIGAGAVALVGIPICALIALVAALRGAALISPLVIDLAVLAASLTAVSIVQTRRRPEVPASSMTQPPTALVRRRRRMLLGTALGLMAVSVVMIILAVSGAGSAARDTSPFPSFGVPSLAPLPPASGH